MITLLFISSFIAELLYFWGALWYITDLSFYQNSAFKIFKWSFISIRLDIVYVYIYIYIYIIHQLWLIAGQWFSPGPPVSSTNKTDRHDITEISLKVALNTITLTLALYISYVLIHIYYYLPLFYTFVIYTHVEMFMINHAVNLHLPIFTQHSFMSRNIQELFSKCGKCSSIDLRKLINIEILANYYFHICQSS